MAMADSLDGSIDEAAQAIEALMSPPAGPEPDLAPAADTPEPEAPAEADPEPELENTASEEAPIGDTPAAVAPTSAPTPPVMQPPVAQYAPQAPQQAPTYAQADPLAQINAYIPQLQATLAVEFPDVRTVDDLKRIAVEDPARAIRFQVQREELQLAQQAQARMAQQHQNSWAQAEGAKLAQHPSFADPKAGPDLEQKVRAFARDIGYPPDAIARASANDIIILHENMMYRDSVKAKAAEEQTKAKALQAAKAKAQDAPPVQKPGVSRPASGKDDKAKELRERFEKSGRVDDLAALLAFTGG